MDELDLRKIVIPDSWPEEAKAMVRMLLARVDALEKEVRDLRTRLRLNSSNSNLPPSRDPPGKVRRRRRRSDRKRGGQPGHAGRTRQMVPPEQVDRFETHRPSRC